MSDTERYARARASASVELEVRPSEVDAQGVVWHGNYLAYLDLARSALLARGGLGPEDLARAGLAVELSSCEVRYRAPLRLGERATVEAELVWDGSPSFGFEYRVVRQDGTLAATGTTRHLVLDARGEPVSDLPPIVRVFGERA